MALQRLGWDGHVTTVHLLNLYSAGCVLHVRDEFEEEMKIKGEQHRFYTSVCLEVVRRTTLYVRNVLKNLNQLM